MLVGLVYSLYMAAWYWWQAALHADKPHAVEFCTVWWCMFLGACILSVVGLILYGIETYLKRGLGRYGVLTTLYLAAYVLLLSGAFMWIQFFVTGKT